MSKTVIFTAILPYEVYASYKRKLDYKYDSYYDELEKEDPCLESMYTVLKEIINDEDPVWEYLMKEAYAYATFWNQRTSRVEMTDAVISHVSELMQRDIESISVEVESRVVQLAITFKNEIDSLDDDVIQELLSILAKDVFQVTCDEHLSDFNLEDFTNAIDECDVYLELEDQVSPNGLQYTIEYK